MNRTSTTAAALVLALGLGLVLGLGGCAPAGDEPGGEPTPTATADGHVEGTDHSHRTGPPVGDGTGDYGAGYGLTDVSLPTQPGVPGKVRFVIRGFDGQPIRTYHEEQTKRLHLYVVRRDLAVFRHLHPTQGADGAWSADLTLPEAGEYRVIAEFVADDGGGLGDHMMLGWKETVPGDWTPRPAAEVAGPVGDDRVVNARVEGGLAVGDSGRMTLLVRDAAQRPVKLGTYLGAFAHVTGFHVESGSAVHLHPLGQPEVAEDGTRLGFHTEFATPGEYVLFAQVRVDGMLHTLPVRVSVT